MTTLHVYIGYTKLEDESVPSFAAESRYRYMGGFRVVYPDRFDVTIACDSVLFSTSEKAVEFAEQSANAYLALLEVFEIIPPQYEPTWENISPPN